MRNHCAYSLIAILILGISVTSSYADVSSAAMLFLRIAPGSRAAGMGEAYVAIADDATATHWNPAGLGSHPLSPTWINARIPEEHRPMLGMAALRTGSGSSLFAYDIWVISENGIVRYDGKNWQSGEQFHTKTDETVDSKVKAYFNIQDDTRLNEIVTQVVRANSKVPSDEIIQIRDRVMELAPDDYADRESLQSRLDSLINAYRLCLVRWEQFAKVQEHTREGLKDSVLTDQELERINFAVANSIGRFIPEFLTLPYSAVLTGQPTAIASNGDVLIVGTTDGILRTDGLTWRRLGVEDGLPSENITALAQVQDNILVGTDKGLVLYGGLNLVPMSAGDTLVSGRISAIGGTDMNDIYVAVDADLYHFDGETWSNFFDYTVALDDTPDSIADRLSVHGTDEDKAIYLAKLEDINEIKSDSTTETQSLSNLEPGTIIRVPYVGRIADKVKVVHVDMQNRIWLGTDGGTLILDGDRWKRPSENNPASGPTATIVGFDDIVYVGTDGGLLEYQDGAWRRADMGRLGDVPMAQLFTIDNEIWFASTERVVTRGESRSEISLMHANWLPELAPDLYYDFFSAVFGVGDLGTFGLSATFISYGKLIAMSAEGDSLGDFTGFEIALAGSYGTQLTRKLSAGVTGKIIHSRLSPQGQSRELGKGTSTAGAIDFGFLYRVNPRLTLGTAITNLGTSVTYIDAAQKDPLPRNFAFGFAYKLLRSDYNQLLVTAEINKMLVGLDDGFSRELEEIVLNGGVEFMYSDLFAARAGYIYDQEGQVKTLTVGAGVTPFDWIKFDFAYIPTDDAVALANTLRISLSILP
ncbi:MAG: PorV/PorQ family protein [Candidatus Zixiibacteriota bacterium]|nr:MAG: PorV/PorQ family protein [candidate division Zixibacteria bacterium]